MRYVVAISLLLIYSSGFGQDNKSLDKAIKTLDNALLQKDTAALNRLLHDQLSYGHSNGWIETKADVKNDLYSGKLVYNKIIQEPAQAIIEGKTAAVRAIADIDVLLNGKPVQLKLSVLQVWVWKNKNWVLLSRQSTKI